MKQWEIQNKNQSQKRLSMVGLCWYRLFWQLWNARGDLLPYVNLNVYLEPMVPDGI